MSYLGIDIGQTGCKAVIFNKDGNQLSSSYREYETLIPGEGWAELDSRKVIDSCFTVMREAQAACPHDPVEGMGISCQGEAFTPVSSDGKYLANAMITFDRRAASITSEWSRSFGMERLYNITGHTAHPMFSIFKLLWLRKYRSELFKRAYKFLCFEDLLHHALGLEPHISWSLAGRTMMFNILKHDWEDELLEACGITRSNLAIPVPSGTMVGKIKKDIAKELGFREEVKVVTGGHDQPMGGLGAGVVTPGTAMYATGTSECITPAFTKPILSNDLFRNNLCTYDYTIKGMYTTVAFSLTGGNILRWFRDEFGQEEIAEGVQFGSDAYEILLGKIGTSPSNLLVLPYFTPTGTPYFDPDVYGAILGLNLGTKRKEVLRGLLEGVAFEMRLNLEILNRSGIKINELRAIGGGAKSQIWIQLKADVLNKPITRVQVTEAACFAAAMLAFSTINSEPLPSLINQWVKTCEVIEPIRENGEVYKKRFDTYLKLYPFLKKIKW